MLKTAISSLVDSGGGAVSGTCFLVAGSGTSFLGRVFVVEVVVTGESGGFCGGLAGFSGAALFSSSSTYAGEN